MPSRRQFLAWLGGTAAGVALAPGLDLERLLWVPGAKTISLPTLREVAAVNGWSTEVGVIKKGDVFTFAGVYVGGLALNLQRRMLQQFTVTEIVNGTTATYAHH